MGEKIERWGDKDRDRKRERGGYKDSDRKMVRDILIEIKNRELERM